MNSPATMSTRRGLHEQVVRQLGLRIMRNEVAPGHTLPPEPELCVELNISRTAVREAIKVLAAKGMVESRPKTGTRVRARTDWNLLDPDVLAWRCEVGPEDWFLRDLVEVRLLIEPAAARLAAVRATSDELAALEAWYRRMHIALGDPEAFVTADIQFHATILGASHNVLLQQLITTISAALRTSIALTAYLPGAPEASMPQHAAVLEGIRHHDERAAEAAMHVLISATARDIKYVLYPGIAGGEER